MSFLDRFRKSKPVDAFASNPEIGTGPIPEDITHPDLDVGPEIIDFLYQSMKIDAEWSIREPRSFTWWGHRLAQRIWAEPVQHSDGYAIVRLVAETDLLRRVPYTRNVAVRLAGFNQHASMSAFVWEPVATQDNRIPLESSVNLRCVAYAHPETADTVKKLFLAACGLQTSDAHIKVDRMVPLLGGQPALSDHPTSGRRPLSVIERLFAPAGVGPAPFSATDFRAAARFRGLPWIDSGSKGARLWGGLRSHDHPSGTGILTADAETRHPQLGSGLFTLLNAPFDFEPVEADMLLAVCHELNSEEATESLRSSSSGRGVLI